MRASCFAGILALLLLAPACGGDQERVANGSVVLEWQVAARDCQRADVERVRVGIEGGWTNERGVGEWTFDCADRRGEVTDLAPGRYIFEMTGLAADATERFAGVTERVEVRSNGTSRPGTVILQAAVSSLRVEWTFGGPFCSHVGVTDIELMAFDDWGTAIGALKTTCDAGSAELDLRPGNYDVAVFGLSGEGMLLYHNVFDANLVAGAKHTRRVTLEVVED